MAAIDVPLCEQRKALCTLENPGRRSFLRTVLNATICRFFPRSASIGSVRKLPVSPNANECFEVPGGRRIPRSCVQPGRHRTLGMRNLPQQSAGPPPVPEQRSCDGHARETEGGPVRPARGTRRPGLRPFIPGLLRSTLRSTPAGSPRAPQLRGVRLAIALAKPSLRLHGSQYREPVPGDSKLPVCRTRYPNSSSPPARWSRGDLRFPGWSVLPKHGWRPEFPLRLADRVTA